MPLKINGLNTLNLRFPTSRTAGWRRCHAPPTRTTRRRTVILKTDTRVEGHGFAFTIGRGNDICAAARS